MFKVNGKEIKVGKLLGLVYAGTLIINGEIEKAKAEGFYYSAVLSEKLGLGNALEEETESGVFIEDRDGEIVITVDNGEVYPAEYTPAKFLERLVAYNY